MSLKVQMKEQNKQHGKNKQKKRTNNQPSAQRHIHLSLALLSRRPGPGDRGLPKSRGMSFAVTQVRPKRLGPCRWTSALNVPPAQPGDPGSDPAGAVLLERPKDLLKNHFKRACWCLLITVWTAYTSEFPGLASYLLGSANGLPHMASLQTTKSGPTLRSAW